MFKLRKNSWILSTIFLFVLMYIHFRQYRKHHYDSSEILWARIGDDSCNYEHEAYFSASLYDNEEEGISISSINQSTFLCSGNMNYENAWRYRTCLFRNICYNKEKEKFLFYQSPNITKIPILFEPKYGHIYDFNYNNHGFVSLQANPSIDKSWSPTIIHQILPKETEAIYLDETHTLFMHQNIPYNADKFIWEDVGSNFFSMIRMGVYSKNAILIEYENFPSNESKFYEMYNYLIPSFASKVVDFSKYINEYSSNNICFQSLVVGGATPMFSSHMNAFHYGKEQLFYEYRNHILKYHGINLINLPEQLRIILIKKSHQLIKNLDDIEYYIQTTYTHIQLDVIDLDQIPFNRQLDMLYKTTLLIVPSASISSAIPFLPSGASTIILNYPPIDSTHVSIWNYFPHVRKLYYHINSTYDQISNSPDEKNISIIIQINRLKELIDAVLDI